MYFYKLIIRYHVDLKNAIHMAPALPKKLQERKGRYGKNLKTLDV